MNLVNYIIVGGGYAGMFFAHQLIKNGKTFRIFADDKKGASQVSAGIVNPAVLKKFTTFWLAQEQIDFLRQTIGEIAAYTGENYLIDEPVCRIFHDENEKNVWLKKAGETSLKPFLSTDFDHFDTLNNPFGYGEVLQSARLDVPGFFRGMTAYLQAGNYLINETFDYALLAQNSYKNLGFDKIVFCEGIGVKENPFFSGIEILPNKGHHLELKLSPNPGTQKTVKKKHFLFPVSENLHYYGGTYDRESAGDSIDETAVEQLRAGLAEIYNGTFEITKVNFGFRPTVKDRRPILGAHRDYPDYFVFNGLGARGVLNGCYFAKTLYDFTEFSLPLPAEVDIKRFG